MKTRAFFVVSCLIFSIFMTGVGSYSFADESVAGLSDSSKEAGSSLDDDERTMFEKIKDDFDAVLSQQPKVETQLEVLYDVNKDGFLSQDELISLYQDVYDSIKRRGVFSVRTPVLKIFDRDEDGFINDGFEVKYIKRLIHLLDKK